MNTLQTTLLQGDVVDEIGPLVYDPARSLQPVISHWEVRIHVNHTLDVPLCLRAVQTRDTRSVYFPAE